MLTVDLICEINVVSNYDDISLKYSKMILSDGLKIEDEINCRQNIFTMSIPMDDSAIALMNIQYLIGIVKYQSILNDDSICINGKINAVGKISLNSYGLGDISHREVVACYHITDSVIYDNDITLDSDMVSLLSKLYETAKNKNNSTDE